MNHYTVLGLQRCNATQENLSQAELKLAYRRALLSYHPDKAGSGILTTPQDRYSDDRPTSNNVDASGRKPTIDEITTAYHVLSSPKEKAEYDRTLRLKREHESKEGTKFHTGLDIVDLDEMAYDEIAETWYRACRCGQECGYLVTEPQLEDVADSGELVVGCRGCSLWLKVQFGVTANEDG